MNGTVVAFPFRFLVLSMLLGAPFVRMLLQDDYGFLHPEVAAAFVIICGAAAILAAALRPARLFHAAIVVLIVLLSLNAVQLELGGSVRLRWIVPLLLTVSMAGLLMLRQHFYHVLLIFVAGGLSVDVWNAVRNRQTAAADATAVDKNLQHTIHIILDEMIGLAGMPADSGECVLARSRLEKVLADGDFETYPYAYSNYRSTRDSIPSILNAKLLDRSNGFLDDGDPRPVLRQNRYFDELRKRGYAIRVYQSDYLRYTAGDTEAVKARDYRSNSLKALHATSLPWAARLRQLFVIYLQSDQFWWDMWRRALPAERHPERLRVGPLALEHLWPGGVLQDVRAAEQNSLFFVHALTPHYPYVYAADGSVRDPGDWNSHENMEFTADQLAGYTDRYRVYCGQVQFLAAQIAELIGGLRKAGLYDSATVIIHGDHGSRIRFLSSSDEAFRNAVRAASGRCPVVSRYDYASEPDARDLVNRFSTLLAVKRPGATAPQIVAEPGSVLYFLRAALGSGMRPDTRDGDVNSVFLFTPDGSPRAITSMSQAFARLSAPRGPDY